MRQLLIAMLIFIVGTNANASNIDSPPFNASDLQMKWEVVQDNYQNKIQALNAITITNTGKNTFPANGWKMYFNSSFNFLTEGVIGNVKLDHIMGDLFSFSPLNSFAELKPGASVRL